MTASPNDKIRLSTGEEITREELARRVAQKVWQLLQQDMRHANERRGKRKK
jgi:hypothetical protein